MRTIYEYCSRVRHAWSQSLTYIGVDLAVELVVVFALTVVVLKRIYREKNTQKDTIMRHHTIL